MIKNRRGRSNTLDKSVRFVQLDKFNCCVPVKRWTRRADASTTYFRVLLFFLSVHDFLSHFDRRTVHSLSLSLSALMQTRGAPTHKCKAIFVRNVRGCRVRESERDIIIGAFLQRARSKGIKKSVKRREYEGGRGRER